MLKYWEKFDFFKMICEVKNMVIVRRSLRTDLLTAEELIYLQVLEEQGYEDDELEYKLAVLFGLDDRTATDKVQAYRSFQFGETL